LVLLRPCELSLLLIPENVWCLNYFDATLYSLNIAYNLTCGQISWDSIVFAEYIKGISMTHKAVRCQYHIYPIPLRAERSQLTFLRAQEFMENLTGSNSRAEFQLLSELSKEALRQSVQCYDTQANAIAPAALIYLAALHFASTEYQIAIDLCSSVLESPTTDIEIETLNAGCLLFIDDVARIVGLSLLYKKFNENMHLKKKRQIYLDL